MRARVRQYRHTASPPLAERLPDAAHDRAGHPLVGYLERQAGKGESTRRLLLVVDDQDPVGAFLLHPEIIGPDHVPRIRGTAAGATCRRYADCGAGQGERPRLSLIRWSLQEPSSLFSVTHFHFRTSTTAPSGATETSPAVSSFWNSAQ